MGLKVFNLVLKLDDIASVEIRPKWDWKAVVANNKEEAMKRLKSDQNGIERTLRSSNIVNISNLLKSDQNGIERYYIMHEYNAEILGWNQTKMGLKVTCPVFLAVRVFLVEIRPKWDWKLVETMMNLMMTFMLKSDQKGIESFYRHQKSGG